MALGQKRRTTSAASHLVGVAALTATAAVAIVSVT